LDFPPYVKQEEPGSARLSPECWGDSIEAAEIK